MGFGGTIRNPGSKRREGRSWDRLSGNMATVDANSAIQLNTAGQITLVIATDEPFTQSSAGLALTTDNVTLQKTSGTLSIDPENRYENIIYYG